MNEKRRYSILFHFVVQLGAVCVSHREKRSAGRWRKRVTR